MRADPAVDPAAAAAAAAAVTCCYCWVTQAKTAAGLLHLPAVAAAAAAAHHFWDPVAAACPHHLQLGESTEGACWRAPKPLLVPAAAAAAVAAQASVSSGMLGWHVLLLALLLPVVLTSLPCTTPRHLVSSETQN
jgi:hypothetical protein